jgi:predicted nucleic acid-binding protein
MATAFYLDTSALGKRYVDETGSAWVRLLSASKTGHALLTARITMVEMYSVLARRKREGSVPAHACAIAAQAFTAHSVSAYKFIELDMSIIARARDLLDRYPLRAYDSVHLASALVANQALVDRTLSPLVFVSADERLLMAALAEGLSTDNPEQHPQCHFQSADREAVHSTTVFPRFRHGCSASEWTCGQESIPAIDTRGSLP